MASFKKLSSGRWQARVSMQGKSSSIGTFATKSEAEEKAYIFESEIKPHLVLPDIEKELEKEIAAWKERLQQFQEAEHIGKLNNNKYPIEIESIEEIIASKEKALKIFKNKKRIQEKNQIEKIESIFGGILK